MEEIQGFKHLKWAQERNEILPYTKATVDGFITLQDYLRDSFQVSSPLNWIELNDKSKKKILLDWLLTQQDVLIYLIFRQPKDADTSYRNSPLFGYNLNLETRLVNSFHAQWDSVYETETEKLKDFQNASAAVYDDDIEPVQHTYPVIKSVIRSYSPTVNVEGFTDGSSENSEIIFEKAILNQNMPILIYNHPKGSRIRVWIDEDFDSDKILKKLDVGVQDAYILQIILWIPRNARETLQNPGKNSIHRIYYSPYRNLISIDESIPGLLDTLQRSFPFFEFHEGAVSKLRAEFRLFGLQNGLHRLVFAECVLNLFPIRQFFYNEERANLFGERQHPYTHYRSINDGTYSRSGGVYINTASVSFSMSNRKALRTEAYKLYNDETYEFQEGEPYVLINITRANDDEVMHEFVRIFTRCYAIYQKNFERIYRYLRYFIPKIQQYEELHREKRKIEENRNRLIARAGVVKRASKNSYLQALSTLGMNIGKASRKVSADQDGRPEVIDAKDVAKYDGKSFRFQGKKFIRRVLKFPLYPKKDDKVIHLVCMDESKPFLGLRVNKSDGEYPFIPRCYAQANRAGPGSLIDNYYRSLEGNASSIFDQIDTRRRGKTGIALTNVVLDPEGVGMLHANIINVMNAENVLRFGVARSSHGNIGNAICRALDQKRITTNKLREKLLPYLNACIQEIYAKDLTLDDAKIQLQTGYIDELLFYRACEEYFQVNLVFFNMPAGELAIPPYIHYHSRFARTYRKTICIVRNFGAEIDALLHPHCELVAVGDKLNYGRKFSHRIHRLIQDSVTTYTADVKNTDTLGSSNEIYCNLFTTIDIVRMIPYPAVSQMIDTEGKAYAFTFELKKNSFFTISCLPVQPEPLPINQRIYPVENRILRKLGKVSGYSIEDGEVHGVWCEVCNFPWAIYTPVNKYTAGENELRLPNHTSPFFRKSSIVQRQISIYRQHKIIKNIVEYLIQVMLATNPNAEINDFIRDVLLLDTKIAKEDSERIYDLTTIGAYLPQGKTYHEILLSLHTIVPTLVNSDGKLRIYNEAMAQGLIDYVYFYHHNMRSLSFSLSEDPYRIQVNRLIPNFYESNEDYHMPNGYVFMDQNQFSRWNQMPQLKVTQKIILDTNIPHIYETGDGKLYLVQPTESDRKNQALFICQQWQQQHTNPGSGFESDPRIAIHYYLYTLDSAHQLVFYREKNNDDTPPCEILTYEVNGSRRVYAALLPL